MDIEYHPNFRNKLAAIINSHSESLARGFAKELVEIAETVEIIESPSDYSTKVSDMFTITRIKPRAYDDRGYTNCDHLFYEHTFNLRGGYASLMFYIPYMAKSDIEQTELGICTKQFEQKVSNSRCIEFYHVVYTLPDF